MHTKSWCIDEEVYIGGSYNFTMHAEKSVEQLIVVKDSVTAAEYVTWFQALCKQSDGVKHNIEERQTILEEIESNRRKAN